MAIARAGRAATFPARFQLIAAMNPCPCGFFGSDRGCPCPIGVVERYQRKVSGPLRDRIDLWVEMPRVPPAAVVGRAGSEPSAVVAARIAAARALARRRVAPADAMRVNGRLTGRALRAACALSPSAERHVVRLAELEEASGRGTERLLRVARTIADLAGDAVVAEAHLDEAAWFRAPAARRAATRAR